MKILNFLICILMCSTILAENKKEPKIEKNVEIKASYKKDNVNYIYLESKSETIKLRRKVLGEEAAKQILKNKEVELTLFVPVSSVVWRRAKDGGKAELPFVPHDTDKERPVGEK